MPLLDHFHPPIYPQRAWESFHWRWANSIAEALQLMLPRRYSAEVQIHLGSQVEADVAELEPTALPAAAFVLPAVFPDDLEVQVRDERDDARLVGVVELLRLRNKDRPESRRAFAAKCAAYLQRGIGVMILDIVTSRSGNLHNELIELLNAGTPFLLPAAVSLYAVSYRPSRQADANGIAVWPAMLTLGAALPVLPLGLRGFGSVPIDLEATYSDARQLSRL
jgi:hypothetical protein